MEMNINDIFPNEITKLGHTFLPDTFSGTNIEIRHARQFVIETVECLGRHSANAQFLPKPITTLKKIQTMNDVAVYVLKDKDGNDGKGEAIGILKIGRKHLYIHDSKNQTYEVEPVCILDFYVEKKNQRSGCGEKLINYMLQDNNITIHEVAIDGPSETMKAFLKKKYGLETLLPQSNNYSLPPKFFDYLDKVRAPPRSGSSTARPAPAGRFTALAPNSGISVVIHGGSPSERSSRSGAKREAAVAQTPERAVAQTPEPNVAQTPEPGLAQTPEPGLAQTPELSLAQTPEEAFETPSAPAPEPPQRPSTLHVETSPGTGAQPSPAGSLLSRRDSQLTEQGFFDVKFYHNKLW